MKQLHFKYHYEKLNNIDTGKPVQLVFVSGIDGQDLPIHFTKADTFYNNQQDGQGYYPEIQPCQHYLLLIFRDIHGTLFTTLRKDNPENEQTYTPHIGHYFQVIITKE